jgi:hypothetical protein
MEQKLASISGRNRMLAPDSYGVLCRRAANVCIFCHCVYYMQPLLVLPPFLNCCPAVDFLNYV